MADGPAILIAAQSGRALAQAARRAGLRPYVLDLFGDADTREAAEAYLQVAARFGTGRMGGRGVLAALGALAARAGGGTLGLIIGSGFEGAPDLVAAMAESHRVLGADAAAIRRLKDPQAFAALCRALAVPHPAIAMQAVREPRRWLCKRAGGSGGTHIRAAFAGPPSRGRYFQERVSGTARALNFIGGRDGIHALALTEQWSSPSPLRPHRYGGALEPGRGEGTGIAPAVHAAIVAAVERLADAVGLRGLASADVLVDGADWWLLEINPRPGATLDVLDRRTTPLLDMHISACLGGLSRPPAPPSDAAAAEICYAPRPYDAVRTRAWPDYVADRPTVGTCVARDAPLCTITASGPDAASVRDVLRTRQRMVLAMPHEEESIDGYRSETAEHQRAVRAAG